MILSDAADYYITSHIGVHSPKTVKRRRDAIRELLDYAGDVDVATITIKDLRQYRANMLTRPNKIHPETTLSPYTVAGWIRDVKVLFKWWQEEGIIDDNPAERLKAPRLDDMPPKAISMESFSKLLAAVELLGWRQAGGEVMRARDRAMLLFLADSGCRRASLVKLTLDMLEVDRGQAIVQTKGRLKTKSHTVFFSPPTARALEDWLNHRKRLRPAPKTDHVFVALTSSHFGQPLNGNAITITCHRLSQLAGLPHKYGPHSLRHAAAREWIRNGATLDQVSRLLGHSGIEVTYLHYARWDNGELAEIHGRVSHIDRMEQVQ